MFPTSRSSGRCIIGALAVFCLSGLCAAGWTPAQASPTPQASLVTVASFDGANGEEPHAGVTFDSHGNLFGTTYEGGTDEVGTVYEIAKGSTTITDVAAFDQSNGDNPEAGVTFDSQGNLFGTTAGGGTNHLGVVYEIAKGSTAIAALFSFNGGSVFEPQGGLTLDSQGNLFGTASGGGAKDAGTVYEIVKGSTRLKIVAFFNGANGKEPCSGLTFDSSGNLFGTTHEGGENDKGTVFEIVRGSTSIKTVDSFDGGNGSYPQSSVTFDRSGNLFGTTNGGGPDDRGTVFKIVKGSATITTLAAFNSTTGDSPDVGVTFDSHGNLFGTASRGGAHNQGTVYEIAQGSTHLKTLVAFSGANGSQPEGLVAFDSSGNLFGTTAKGGANDKGTVYEIAAPGSSAAAALTPAQASPAAKVPFITVASFARVDGAYSDGVGPYASVTFDRSGNLFGTTYAGDTSGNGTVFEITKGSTSIKTLASFNGIDGSQPDGRLSLDSSGNLFGTTTRGGASGDGVVFEIVKGSRHIKTIASFSQATGENPHGGVTFNGHGNLFGTTWGGGASGGGTVYEIVKGSRRIKTLAYFNHATIFRPGGTRSAGSGPIASLVFDRQGNLFGTTGIGGESNQGVVYEIIKGSTQIRTLVSFDGTNGGDPLASVTFDSQGNLYGTTHQGGADNNGTVFEIVKGSTQIKTLAFFNGANGKGPSGVVLDSQGNLFGTTYSGGTDDAGTVYEIAKGSAAITVLVFFTGANGSVPSGVTFDRQGNLFGTTESGGMNDAGTVFKIVGVGLRSAAPKLPRKSARCLHSFPTLLRLSGPVLRARKHTG